MSFILKILDKTVKIDNEIIIGRGAPFELLNDHKDIARAHAQIKEEKHKLWIQALDEDKPTIVNCQRLKPHKYVAITTKDKIQLGDTPLELMKGITASHIEKIERFSNSEMNNYPFHKIWGFIFAFLFLSIQFLSPEDSGPPITLTSNLIGSSILSLLIAIPLKFTMLLTKGLNPNKHTVYVGKKGFTVHYDHSNMSVLFKDIESYKNIMGVLQIRAYGKEIALSRLDKYAQLNEYLEKNCGNKRVSSTRDNFIGVVGLIFGILIVLLAKSDRFNFSQNISFMLIILVALSFGLLILAFNPKYYAKVYKTNASNHAKNKNKLILASLGCLFFSYYEYKQSLHVQKNQVLAKNCMQGNLEECRLIDSYTVAEFRINEKTKKLILEKSCEAGNKSACYCSQRKPASLNK